MDNVATHSNTQTLSATFSFEGPTHRLLFQERFLAALSYAARLKTASFTRAELPFAAGLIPTSKCNGLWGRSSHACIVAQEDLWKGASSPVLGSSSALYRTINRLTYYTILRIQRRRKWNACCRTVHVISLKTCTNISTPIGAQVANNTTSVKHLNYIPICFGALRTIIRGKTYKHWAIKE
jgi:hypothetical protein